MKKTSLIMGTLILPLLASCSIENKNEQKIIEKPNVEITDGMLTPEVLEAFGRISQAEPSPDGRSIIFTLSYEDIVEKVVFKNFAKSV